MDFMIIISHYDFTLDENARKEIRPTPWKIVGMCDPSPWKTREKSFPPPREKLGAQENRAGTIDI